MNVVIIGEFEFCVVFVVECFAECFGCLIEFGVTKFISGFMFIVK